MTPPHGLDQVCQVFGDARAFATDPADWELRVIRTAPLTTALIYAGNPGLTISRVRAHGLLAAELAALLMACLAAGVPQERLKYGGAYNYRPKRGSTAPSLHSWGIAVDLEPLENPLGEEWQDDGHMLDPRIIRTFTDAGWCWGGTFHGRKDPQHFQFATEV